MKQIKLTPEMKRKLLTAVTTGLLDLDQHPELMQACMEEMKIKPISIETARKIMTAFELEGMDEEQILTRAEAIKKRRKEIR